MDNSKLLHNIVEILQNHNYKDIMIKEKYTSNKEILIGLTIDYRHLEDWQSFKDNKEPMLREMIQRSINVKLSPNPSSKNRPFIQIYSSHPFLDVYGIECNKGIAFDNILSHLEKKDREAIIWRTLLHDNLLLYLYRMYRHSRSCNCFLTRYNQRRVVSIDNF
jgi:hypothetical protein